MLALLKTTETVRLVCISDPAVKPKKKVDEAVAWIPQTEARTGDDPMVVTARPLSSSELLIAQATSARSDSSPEMDLTLRAAHVAVERIEAPGIAVSTPDEVFDVLERFPPAELAALGSWILLATMLPEDPTEAAD